MLWNNNKDDSQQNRLSDKYDIHPLAGFWSGVGELLSNPGQYYVQANWKGNGLANTRLGYLADPGYRDPFSAGQALASLGNLGVKDKGLWQNILGQSTEDYMKGLQKPGLYSFGSNLDNILGPTYNITNTPYNGINKSLPTTVNYNRPSWEK